MSGHISKTNQSLAMLEKLKKMKEERARRELDKKNTDLKETPQNITIRDKFPELKDKLETEVPKKLEIIIPKDVYENELKKKMGSNTSKITSDDSISGDDDENDRNKKNEAKNIIWNDDMKSSSSSTENNKTDMDVESESDVNTELYVSSEKESEEQNIKKSEKIDDCTNNVENAKSNVPLKYIKNRKTEKNNLENLTEKKDDQKKKKKKEIRGLKSNCYITYGIFPRFFRLYRKNLKRSNIPYSKIYKNILLGKEIDIKILMQNVDTENKIVSKMSDVRLNRAFKVYFTHYILQIMRNFMFNVARKKFLEQFKFLKKYNIQNLRSYMLSYKGKKTKTKIDSGKIIREIIKPSDESSINIRNILNEKELCLENTYPLSVTDRKPVTKKSKVNASSETIIKTSDVEK